MNKILCEVPAGIQYISEWTEYKLPEGQCVVNKGLTGCGYTEMCLTNPMNIVLCSPRKMLLENKAEQHKMDFNILYLENNSSLGTTKSSYFDFAADFHEKMTKHIIFCAEKQLPVKFLVTYDSSKYVIDYLKNHNMLDKYYIVADEMQAIFTDSIIKPDVEIDFLEGLKICPNVTYLSATPMLDEYLDYMDEFKNLPYYQLDWKNSNAVETRVVNRKRVNSLGQQMFKIIDDYRNGKFPIHIDSNGNIIQSMEAVFYVNSIKEIISAVNKKNLSPEEVNILCSDTDDNSNKLKRSLGRDYKIGKIPLKGEPHKMFTFCTSTVYVGADFYSTCASTFIFADPNLSCLALDISIDLPQIMGRQRLKTNPFRNIASMFYRTISTENQEEKSTFDEAQENRKRETAAALSVFNKCSNDDEKRVFLKRQKAFEKTERFTQDFLSISKVTGKPVYNKLIELSHRRAWEVSQGIYQNPFSVTTAIDNLDHVDNVRDYKDGDDRIVDDFMNAFSSTNLFVQKMRMYCEFMDTNRDNGYLIESVGYRIGDPKFRNYYNLFGTSGCRAVGFQEARIVYMMNDLMKTDQLREAIVKKFPIKMRISKKKAKEELGEIYKSLGINATPKATEIENYLELREVKIPEGGKRVNGYEIIALK